MFLLVGHNVEAIIWVISGQIFLISYPLKSREKQRFLVFLGSLKWDTGQKWVRDNVWLRWTGHLFSPRNLFQYGVVIWLVTPQKYYLHYRALATKAKFSHYTQNLSVTLVYDILNFEIKMEALFFLIFEERIYGKNIRNKPKQKSYSV